MTSIGEGRGGAEALAAPTGGARRTLIVSGAAHAVHDGFADLIYVLLPIWQAEFALGYGALALLRGVYSGAMGALQIPSSRLAERLGGRAILAAGTVLAALGFALAGASGGLAGLCVALAVSGVGSSAQHPIASAAVSRAYATKARGAIGVYNFSGDVGKATFPAAMALLLTLTPWREALWWLAGFGALAAVGILAFLPSAKQLRPQATAKTVHGGGRGGFSLLLSIGMLDTSVRVGLLTFLPFLLADKGADLPTVGLALSLLFIGGAVGKFACGWLSSRIGVVATVLVTEGGTAAAILALIFLPLAPALMASPLLGVLLNGTSSALYGTVPELAAPDRTEDAFALFYTGVIGAGAVAPVLYGLMGDAIGVNWATVATAATALGTFPLTLILAPRLKRAS